jgi:impB/mucB/samB family C-terminal domain
MRAGEKLRQDGLAAGAIAVFIEPNRESRTNKSPFGSATLALAPMTNVTTELQELAFRTLDRIFEQGLWYNTMG